MESVLNGALIERELLRLFQRVNAPILAFGFAAFFHGDFMAAAHMVLPQIEPCLRQVLLISGTDPSKRRDDGTEEDLSLNSLFGRFRVELEAIFGPDLSTEIERLFDLRPGPAIRHQMAHGQLSAGGCFHSNIVYAIWLMYRLCVVFLLEDWGTLIRPAIEAT